MRNVTVELLELLIFHKKISTEITVTKSIQLEFNFEFKNLFLICKDKISVYQATWVRLFLWFRISYFQYQFFKIGDRSVFNIQETFRLFTFLLFYFKRNFKVFFYRFLVIFLFDMLLCNLFLTRPIFCLVFSFYVFFDANKLLYKLF